MGTTWIVSANASRARFYSQANLTTPLEEINDMVNESSRQRMLDTTESDKIGPLAATGSMHNVGGTTPNKLYEPPQSPVKHEAELFARDIAGYLLKGYQDGRFEKLVLVVSPQFLGMLRKLLDPQLESAVSLEIDKDYTLARADELRQHIEDHKP
jgi:protein required for attachment to host cells